MTAEGLRDVVEGFVRGAKKPAALEPGEDWIELGQGSFVLAVRGGRLTMELWSGARSVTRRVTGIAEQRRGRLELTVERFARREGRLWLVDRGRPEEAAAGRRGGRMVFREEFRRFLAREYPRDAVAQMSSETDLEHTLSPKFPRAFLRRGRTGAAAIGCPAGEDSAEAVTFGLIWLDYVRRREPKVAIERLVLYAAAEGAEPARQRLRWLTVASDLHAFTKEGFTSALDLADAGNLDTVIEPLGQLGADAERWVRRVREIPGVCAAGRADGSVSLRVMGIEFARAAGRDVRFGLSDRVSLGDHNLPQLRALAEGLIELRRDAGAPMHAPHPEAWLEDIVRDRLALIDPAIEPGRCYGQAPAMVAANRSVIDLLAAERSGRLVVVELKASEDPHLPLQALDYWIRVAAHLERGDFDRAGYFGGVALRRDPPRVVLVAPALDFHPTTETLLRFFDPRIEIERVGVNQGWREELRVVFRARGADRPGIGE